MRLKQTTSYLAPAVLLMLVFGSGRGWAGTFKEDVAFLERHVSIVELSDREGNARICVAPGLQGRVMTSTTSGPDGPSFGWINRAHISSGRNDLHMNAFGGEDRFWLGPEGGQYSIFFKPGDPFDLDHWFTPSPINEGEYAVVGKSASRLSFHKDMKVRNYSNAEFLLRLDRDVRLLERAELERVFGTKVDPDLACVGFESNNRITNTGAAAWREETGLLSVWILGMFNPSPSTTVVIPFIAGDKRVLGEVVNDEYFGKVPAGRLQVRESVLFFCADGRRRSKIGIPKRRARPVLGSYDAENKVLTIVQYSLPDGPADYVNSMWKIQEDPYSGDVVNSYNDGPPGPGLKPMGPFYELETSSPAAALRPGAALTHLHRTIHLNGDEARLDKIARATLGVSIKEIKSALSRPAP